jgi:hypothetical protein
MRANVRRIAAIVGLCAGFLLLPISVHVSKESGVTASIDQAQAARAARGGRAAVGPRGGAVAHRSSVAVGPRGGAARSTTAVRGPRGNVAVRSNTAAKGPRGNVAVRGGTAVRANAVVRPVRPWVSRPYYGTVVGGIALGTIIAATVVPTAPADNLCWYWSNSSHSRGYWDYCQ